MGSLVSIFRQKNKIFIIKKHENTREWEKTKMHRIEKFLRFCEAKYIKDIHQIEKKNYDMFIENLNKQNKSDETIRKYSLVLKEFFNRAHLDINVSPNRSKKRRITKKMTKIREILTKNEIEISEQIIKKIEKIL